MKTVGFLLIALGTLGASWVSSQDATEVDWTAYAVAFVVGVIGVVMARAGARSEAQAGDKLSGDVESLQQSILRLADNSEALDRDKASTDVYTLHEKIDELCRDDLLTFADARESIAHLYGLQAYADVMNEFAAGERYLNRVWSASVDGYVDECHTYLARARHQFASTRDKLQALGAAAS